MYEFEIVLVGQLEEPLTVPVQDVDEEVRFHVALELEV